MAAERTWRYLALIMSMLAVALVTLASCATARPGIAPDVKPATNVSLASYTESPGNRLLDAAESRTGAWYAWGGAGPWSFDCSGLVAWSAHQTGIYLPHSTYSMLSSPMLYRVYTPQRGDLAFFGPGHVEIVTKWWHTTFGAQGPGTRVGWHVWNAWWHPAWYERVR
jgi:cell wall-associated NlpC family hydrolase